MCERLSYFCCSMNSLGEEVRFTEVRLPFRFCQALEDGLAFLRSEIDATTTVSSNPTDGSSKAVLKRSVVEDSTNVEPSSHKKPKAI